MAKAKKLLQRAGVAVGAMGLALGGTLALASPAQAACAYDYTNHSVWSSYAEAETMDCSYWSNSYAQHGSLSVFSGWYSGSSWAWADSGFSFSHNARNYFG